MPRKFEKPKKQVSAVKCPHCEYAYSEAVHGRMQPRGYRRRRVCLKCSKGFITYEVTATELNRWAVEGGSPFGGKRGKKHSEIGQGRLGISGVEASPDD